VALLRIVLVLLALAATGLAVTAWLAGDPSELEIEYEGFD
jgi:uncharacterized membrane-anchored protein